MFRTTLFCLLASFLILRPAAASADEPPDGVVSAEEGRPSLSDDRRRGRTRLALGQGAHGLVLGAEAALIVGPEPGVVPAAALGGAAVGVTTALLLTPNGIDTGHAGLLNSGSLWGGFVGFTASRAHYGIGPRGRLGVAMAGQLGGLILGDVAFRLFEPTYAQTWVVDSVALWTTALLTSGLAVANGGSFPERPMLAGFHAWGATAGLIGGGVLAWIAPPMDTMRILALNGGGVLGGLAGTFIIGFAVPTSGSAAIGFTVGAPIGIALAALMTRDAKQRRAKRDGVMLSLGVTEFDDGSRGLTIGGRF